MYKSILVAADGSENSLRAAREAANLARLVTDAEVTVIYVIDPDEAGREEIYGISNSEHDTDRQQKMRPITDFLEEKGVEYKVEMIRGYPSLAIAEYANDRDFDMLIMGKRGLNPMQEMVLGSVSRSVIDKVDMPVLIVK